jgi:hypothetical protein
MIESIDAITFLEDQKVSVGRCDPNGSKKAKNSKFSDLDETNTIG